MGLLTAPSVSGVCWAIADPAPRRRGCGRNFCGRKLQAVRQPVDSTALSRRARGLRLLVVWRLRLPGDVSHRSRSKGGATCQRPGHRKASVNCGRGYTPEAWPRQPSPPVSSSSGSSPSGSGPRIKRPPDIAALWVIPDRRFE